MQNTKNQPAISVIIPTYNRAHLIGRAIQSVLDQTYQDFEIIVVNDGSTDNTDEVIKVILKNHDKIIYIRHMKNKGAGAARNTGIIAANGIYIAFQDSDDEWLPEKLEKQMAVFKTAQAELGIVYTDMWRISGIRKTYWSSPKITPEDNIFYNKALDYGVLNIGIGTALIKKECFDKIGILDDKFPAYEDLEFFIRASRYYCFNHIPEPLVNYFVGEGVSSNTQNIIKARKMLLEKYFDDIKKNNNSLANHYFRIGTDLCIIGEIKEANSYFIKAIELYPTMREFRKSISNHYFGIGTSLFLSGDFLTGRLYFIKAFKANPTNLKFSLGVFISCLGESFFNELLKCFIKLRGQFIAYYKMAVSWKINVR